MAQGGAEDGAALNMQQEPKEAAQEQLQEQPASEVAGRRTQRGCVRPPRARAAQQRSDSAAAAPADATQPASSAAAAAAGTHGQQHKHKREGAAPEAPASEGAADALGERLAALFRKQKKMQLWLEVDMAAWLGPHEMVGRRVRVFWQEDNAWYFGTIIGFDESTGEHMIHYGDNEQESVVIALEKVRLLVTAGEPLARPDRGTLCRHAAMLRRLAGEKKWAAQAARLRSRAGELEELAKQPQPELEAQERAAAEERARAAAAQPQQQRQPQQQQLPPPAPPPSPQQPEDHESAMLGDAAGADSSADAETAADAAVAAVDAAAYAGEPAAEAAPAQQRQLQPGEVGWFQVKGYPAWPFLVITWEEAMARGLKEAQVRPTYLPVQYFGTGEVQGINPEAVERAGRGKRGALRPCFATFPEGLERGYHAVSRCCRAKDFRRALFEVEQYFTEGELPPYMKPWHNDRHDMPQDEKDNKEAGDGKPPAKRRKGKQAAAAGSEASLPLQGAVTLPMEVNKQLEVLALGEVEWLHPAFHNEKCIFPVGYRACRKANTPASGGEALHVLEVLRASDGSGPLFRVTLKGCPSVEGPTATKAWKALYDAASQARVVDVSGDVMFGLASAKVQRAIRTLPGAERCERYLGWPEGEEPAEVPLSDEEKRERLACESRMLRLPDGAEGVPAATSSCACHVCGEDDEEEQDQHGVILSCARCRVHVHTHCYFVQQAPPPGQPWLCDPCSVGLSRPPPCALCPVLGGALKRTSCGRWVHPTCALWLPEPEVNEEARELHLVGVVKDLHKVKPQRYGLKCQFCQQRNAGACMQCCEPKCFASFHPLCARQAGCRVRMEFVYSNDDEPCKDQGAKQDAAPQPQQQQQQQQEAGAGISGDENDAAATNGSGHDLSRHGGGSKAKPQRRQEGTQRGNLCFLAFCPAHSEQRYPRDAAAAAPAVARKRRRQEHQHQQQQQQQQAAPPADPCGAARALPFNHAARRGLRAPEAEAAALAKRRFMCATPYLVGGPVQQGATDVPDSVCHRRPAAIALRRAASEAHPAAEAGEGAAAAAGEQQVQQQQAQQQEEQQQAPQQQQLLRWGAGSSRQPPWFPSRLLTEAEGGQPGSPPAGQHRVGWCPTQGLQSEAERFGEMVAAAGQRVTIGKSAIHGWGGFAKTALKAHDMVIEYVGELVRHSVADLRERRLYDAKVGAGTYVFRLNGQWCVDATCAGNLAHMLNHSCSPNCYSRTIRWAACITGRGGTETDHVVLFAARDIEAGEELTYNYRFCGQEQLRCNCGAPGCTGLVNEKPPDHDRPQVPRAEVKPYLRQPQGRGTPASAPVAAAAEEAAAAARVAAGAAAGGAAVAGSGAAAGADSRLHEQRSVATAPSLQPPGQQDSLPPEQQQPARNWHSMQE
ncbi:hypothetical protein ABPG75_003396 [Micractinium tetrahymenae]